MRDEEISEEQVQVFGDLPEQYKGIVELIENISENLISVGLAVIFN